jgi:hypothetical protein
VTVQHVILGNVIQLSILPIRQIQVQHVPVVLAGAVLEVAFRAEIVFERLPQPNVSPFGGFRVQIAALAMMPFKTWACLRATSGVISG